MAKQRGLLEVKFKGRGLRPNKILARDLAEVIKDVETAVLAYLATGADDKITAKISGLSLVEIKAGSAALRFEPQMSEAVTPAFKALATDVGPNSNVTGLRTRARSAVEGIQDFCQTYRCVSELRDKISSPKPLAIIRPLHPITQASPIKLSGETTLYGILEGVGGKEPKAKMRTEAGRVSFDVTQEQARLLGQHLYTRIGVCGIANWDAYSHAILDFKFVKLLDYKDIPFTQAVIEISKEFGHFFSTLDVAAFIKEQRGE